MSESTIVKALKKLGFDSNWVATEKGIVLWENEEPQPTEKQLKDAGWVKPKDEE